MTFSCMKIRPLYIWLFIGIIAYSSCGIKRSLPEGSYLYKGSKIKIIKTEKGISSESLSSELNALIKTPKSNKKFLGIRWKLRFYNLFHTKKQKGFSAFLQRKLGEPPVIYDEKLTEQKVEVFENRAFNNGFFDPAIKTKIRKCGKFVKVKYLIEVSRPSLIFAFTNKVQYKDIRSHIDQIQNASLIKTGEPYNLKVLKKERERITVSLRQSGYYFFRDDYLIFRADTTTENKQIRLELVLKNNIKPTHLKPQRIDQIRVLPDLNVQEFVDLSIDTIFFEGIEIVSRAELIRPVIFRKSITLKNGNLYSLEAHQMTLERLSFLQNHQFIDLQFIPSIKADSLLDVQIQLTPRKRDVIEGSLGLSIKSGLYFGPEISLSYLNRNLFRGAERMKITATGNYNFPLVEDIASLQEESLTAELSKPQLIVPFRKRNWSESLIAKSKGTFTYKRERVKLPLKNANDFLEAFELFDLAQRLQMDSTFAPFVALNNYEFSLTYQWRKRKDIQHELTPLNFVLQSPRYEFPEVRRLFLEIIALDSTSSDGVLLNLEEMLILKPHYTFLYDSRLKKIKTNNYYYRGKAAIAVNRLLAENSLVSGQFGESQFFQIEQDFRYYLRLSIRQTIGFRLAANVSVPIRNEVLLPFFDLYSIGGPTSVRAFQPRQVGPGSVAPMTQTFFFTGTGDVMLEGSLEWRPKLTKLFELGLFLDAGNVWLLKGGTADNDLTKFQLNNFYNQLAIGTGIGFRFDFDILLLRLDFAFPLTKPWLPEGERWVGNLIDFGSRDWRMDNLTFNLAFGYSF